MAQRMADVYKVSVKDHRAKLKGLLTRNEKAYEALNNKDSEYAIAIKSLQDLHRAAYLIYKNAPDEIV